MKKYLHNSSLWGVLTLSLLSSCRIEDGLTQKQQEKDMRFSVLIPKSGKSVNYADGFAFLMKKYDNVNGTNISGIHNTKKSNLNASISPLFQNTGSYIEFKVRSFVMTEENGEKWVIFPRVENNQVIGLIMCTLKEKETLIAFDEIKRDSDYYKQLLPLFQEAFNRYNRRKISLPLNASIKPMALGGGGETPGGCGDDVQQCGEIEEVVIPGKPKEPKEPPSKPIGSSACESISQCPPPYDDGSGGDGGDYNPNPEAVDKIDVEDLKDYPCAYAIAQELPNLKNDLGTVLNKIFKNSDKYNIKFKTFTPTPKNEKDDGFIKSVPIREGDKFNSTIFLNEDVLRNATKEYILVTMYHEVVHAYLNYQLHTMGQEKFSLQYPGLTVYKTETYYDSVGKEFRVNSFVYIDGHAEAGYYLDTLEQIIREYNPSISIETAKALAKAGIVTLTINEKKINDRERGIDKTLGQQEGMKCTN
ncbi:hypothetical protein [Elizabethkingia meningoseptica]|uniref:hypothetical protein n=1 Tax=Elizabethkingia meningoseptica TaxID=238 RepID=UPI0023B00CC4|nr:hypothetical protein [Elizabethkingia meningoseptica]